MELHSQNYPFASLMVFIRFGTYRKAVTPTSRAVFQSGGSHHFLSQASRKHGNEPVVPAPKVSGLAKE